MHQIVAPELQLISHIILLYRPLRFFSILGSRGVAELHRGVRMREAVSRNMLVALN